MKAVRFHEYGGPEVLGIEDVELPPTGPEQVLVQVRAASLNLGEAKIRSGVLADRFPTAFPSGEGSDFAGVIGEVGAAVTAWSPGQEVAGWTDERASHAEAVVVPADQLVLKPDGVSWEVAGSLFVIGTTAWATVQAVHVGAGDVVVVAGAGGSVGSLAGQLARRRGARVVGIAAAADHDWLRGLGIEPIAYGNGIAQRLRDLAPALDALIDTAGHGYVRLGIELGIAGERIDTIVDFPAAAEYGVKTEGNAAAADAGVLAQLMSLVADRHLELAIDRTFPLTDVVDAYRYLEHSKGRGKVVLRVG